MGMQPRAGLTCHARSPRCDGFTDMLDALRVHRDETAREHASLQSLRELDPLTGLHNRRRLSADLDRACQSGQRSGEPFTVVMLDVDHFKEFNDVPGHQAGDEGSLPSQRWSWGAIRTADTASGSVAGSSCCSCAEPAPRMPVIWLSGRGRPSSKPP